MSVATPSSTKPDASELLELPLSCVDLALFGLNIVHIFHKLFVLQNAGPPPRFLKFLELVLDFFARPRLCKLVAQHVWRQSISQKSSIRGKRAGCWRAQACIRA